MSDTNIVRALEAEVSRLGQEICNLKTELQNFHYINEMFVKAFHNSQAIIAVLRLEDGVYIDVNNTWTDTLGYSREELIGKSALALNLWLDPKAKQDMDEQLAKDGFIKDFESEYRKKSGDIAITLSSMSILDINGEECILISSIDITKRKKAEEALLLSEEKFAKAFYNNQTPMCITSFKDGLFIDVNERYTDIFGYNKEEILGKSVSELDIWANPKDRKDMNQRLTDNGYIRDMEYEFRVKTGEIGYSIASFNSIDMENKKYILTSLLDITKRKQAEEALIQSQNLLSRIFNNSPLPIVIISLKERRVIEVNDIFLRKNNFTREIFLALKGLRLDQWEDAYKMDEYIKLVRQHGSILNYETAFHIATGELKIVTLSGVTISWQGEECILIIGSDITQLREYQHEMSRLSNLKYIGQMAASIAHEIRNPITTIRGFLQLFQGNERYREDSEEIDLIIEELDRVNDIITAFLSLARSSNIDLKIQSLNDNIINLLPLLMADATKNGISIKTEIQDVAKIMIDEGEFRQLLLNLARNGIEAMSAGGTLTIRTFEDRNGVNLVVEDNGHGMSPEVLKQIGTPFFTTKIHGTGLGLPVCYSIAERHNARIDINTSPEGTVFNVIFPVGNLIADDHPKTFSPRKDLSA